MVNRKEFLSALKVFLSVLLFMAIAVLDFTPLHANLEICLVGDLNGNGVQEKYILNNHRLMVKEDFTEIWVSPREYRIDSFSLGDVNNDGTTNLVISLWKQGSFGEMKPFWHTEENKDYKNHLFVYRLDDHTFKQVWCSSNLVLPIISFKIEDLDKDGLNELVVTEGQYKKVFGSRYAHAPIAQPQITVWEWKEWGFQLKSPVPNSEI